MSVSGNSRPRDDAEPVRPRPRLGSGGRQSLWLKLLKTAVGLGLLLVLLVWNDNGRKLLDVLGGFRPEYVFALFALAAATDGISSTKWGLFLADRGHRLPWWRLFELYLIGRFFSNFLPSMFGGDLARVYLVGRQISSFSVSAASVVMERATGLVGLALLALVGCIVNPAILQNPVIAIPLILSILATGMGVVAFFRPGLFALGVRIADRIPVVRRIAHKIEKLLNDVSHYRSNYPLLLKSLLYSFLFHVVAALNVYVTCLAIGFEPFFLDVMVITPVIMLLSMIPVSPNNIGWWEWCFSVLLVSAGATAAEGLAVALVLRVVNLAASLLGGLLSLRDQSNAPTS